jgi:hypothetical protein
MRCRIHITPASAKAGKQGGLSLPGRSGDRDVTTSTKRNTSRFACANDGYTVPSKNSVTLSASTKLQKLMATLLMCL